MYKIEEWEVEYLRDLAKKQLELANQPFMKKREELWYQHNSLQGNRPIVLMEEITFWPEICPVLKCSTPLAREMEEEFYKQIVGVELLGDDKVVAPYYRMEYELNYERFGVTQEKIVASEGLGFHFVPILEDLESDLKKLSYSKFQFDGNKINRKREGIQEIIGNVMPVEAINITNHWKTSLTQQIVELMGTENMFCAMLQQPKEYHKLMEFILKDTIRLLRFQEEQYCLPLNNGNDYLGSGSYCFNKELPQEDFAGKVRSTDTWGHMNSQESVGVSSEMFREFISPYMERLSKEFGLIYYGCCEPVSDFWEGGIEKIGNLRKVSISPWCDEEYMAEALADRDIIYSRKPSPNYIAIQKDFDEDAFRNHIRKTVQITGKCKTEFIFRDIYRLHGNIEKVKRAVEITREESQEAYI